MARHRKFTRKDGSSIEVNLDRVGTVVNDAINPIEVKYVDDDGNIHVRYLNKNDIELDETYEKTDEGTGIIGSLILLFFVILLIYGFCNSQLPTASR